MQFEILDLLESTLKLLGYWESCWSHHFYFWRLNLIGMLARFSLPNDNSRETVLSQNEPMIHLSATCECFAKNIQSILLGYKVSYKGQAFNLVFVGELWWKFSFVVVQYFQLLKKK